MQTGQTTATPTTAQIIMGRLDEIDAKLARADSFMSLLATPQTQGEPSFMDNLTRLLELLVGGTEQTHASLQELHARFLEPGIARAIERAIREP
jgi:hypothetical protein